MSRQESTGSDGQGSQGEGADDRTAIAKAAEWVSRIMTISLGMVLPGLAGYWLDTWLGTKVVFMLIGFALGGVFAAVQLMTLAKVVNRQPPCNRVTSSPNTAEKEKQ